MSVQVKHTHIVTQSSCIMIVFPRVVISFSLDSRRIPNPPTDLQVSYQEDTRVGFFGHTILNLTWQSPAGEFFMYKKQYIAMCCSSKFSEEGATG